MSSWQESLRKKRNTYSGNKTEWAFLGQGEGREFQFQPRDKERRLSHLRYKNLMIRGLPNCPLSFWKMRQVNRSFEVAFSCSFTGITFFAFVIEVASYKKNWKDFYVYWPLLNAEKEVVLVHPKCHSALLQEIRLSARLGRGLTVSPRYHCASFDPLCETSGLSGSLLISTLSLAIPIP